MTVLEPPPAPPAAPPPAQVKPIPPAPLEPIYSYPPPAGNGKGNGHGDGRGNGHGGHDGDGHHDGHDEPDDASRPPKKRRSIWPLLLDLGLVLMLFGLIIVGRFLIPIGAVIFVVALAGWIREARKDFSGLAD